MKRHQFFDPDMTNKCANCGEVLDHPVHAVTLAQQQALARAAWIELGETMMAEGRKIVDWFQANRGRTR